MFSHDVILEKARLTDTERMVWEAIVKSLLPREAGYFWSQVWDLAVLRAGLTAHRGETWTKNVTAIAEQILTALGVAWEMHCGYRYIVGRRIYWDRTRWAADDYRP